MNRYILSICLLAISAPAVAECDTSIEEMTDTVRSVKDKMLCLTQENQALKKELAELEATPRHTAISWGARSEPTTAGAISSCRTKAVAELNRRGWSASIIEGRVEGYKEGYSVYVSCKFSTVIVAGPKRATATDYVEVLANVLWE